MAYADGNIDVTKPGDGDILSQGDDEIRKFKRQMSDRLATLVDDINADPLVLKGAGTTGLVNGLRRIIPFSAFLTDLHAKENDIASGSLNGFVGNDLYAPLSAYIPNGCVLTLIEWIIDITLGAASVDASIKQKQFANGNPAAIIVNSTNIAVAGTNIVPSVAINHTIDSDFMYYLHLHGNGGAGSAYTVYGARITFNRPSIAKAT